MALVCFFLAIDSLRLNSNVIFFLEGFSDLFSQRVIIFLKQIFIECLLCTEYCDGSWREKMESRADVVAACVLELGLEVDDIILFVKCGVKESRNSSTFLMFLST